MARARQQTVEQAAEFQSSGTFSMDSDHDQEEFKPEVDQEKEDLKARIAELEAQIEAAKDTPKVDPKEVDSGGVKRRYLVQCQETPDWVVEATNEFAAFAEYKRATGIIKTPHNPVVTQTDLPLGRHPALSTYQTVAEIQAGIKMPAAAG